MIPNALNNNFGYTSQYGSVTWQKCKAVKFSLNISFELLSKALTFNARDSTISEWLLNLPSIFVVHTNVGWIFCLKSPFQFIKQAWNDRRMRNWGIFLGSINHCLSHLIREDSRGTGCQTEWEYKPLASQPNKGFII